MERMILQAGLFFLGLFFFLASELPADDRTWTDRNGKFQIEATLLDFDGTNVKLKKKDDGKIISMTLDKLSLPDQVYVRKTMEALGGPASTPNPPSSTSAGKPNERTTSTTRSRIKTPEEVADARASSAPPAASGKPKGAFTGEIPFTRLDNVRKIEVDRNADTTWSIQPDPAAKVKLDGRPKTLRFVHGELPFAVFVDETDFFFASGKPEMVLTVLQMRHRQEHQTMAFVGDTKTGRIISQTWPAKLEPLGLSSDGTMALFAQGDSDDNPFGRMDKLTIADTTDPTLPCIAVLAPFGSLDDERKKAIKWACWIDDGHILANSDDGILALIELSTGKALWRMENRIWKPAFSPGGRYMVLSVLGNGFHLIEVLTGEIIGKLSVPGEIRHITTEKMAFSPDGKRLAVSTWQGIVIWDVTTGNVEEPFFIDHNGDCAWIDDNILLVGGTLVDIKQMIPYWNYTDVSHKSKLFAGHLWNLKRNHDRRNGGSELTGYAVPHAGMPALPQLDERQRFAIRPGMSVKITVDSTVPERDKVRGEMMNKLRDNGIKVDDSASITLALRAARGDSKNVEYAERFGHGRSIGQASFTPYLMTCGFEKDGDVLWEAQTTTSPPGTVSNEDVGRLQSVVSESGKPTADWYIGLTLPKRIPHKKAGESPLGGRR